MDEAPICWRCDQRLFRDVAGNKRADALVWPALDLIKGSLRLLASVLQHASFGKIRAHALASHAIAAADGVTIEDMVDGFVQPGR